MRKLTSTCDGQDATGHLTKEIFIFNFQFKPTAKYYYYHFNRQVTSLQQTVTESFGFTDRGIYY